MTPDVREILAGVWRTVVTAAPRHATGAWVTVIVLAVLLVTLYAAFTS